MTAPAPLVPADVDLKDYDNVPIEFRRLFASDTWTQATDEEKVACFCLWCEAFHQSPAGSLPDNDRQLAQFSQKGARWKKIREHCLRGFIKCSDGRLYHPVMAEKVLEVWARHKKASSKGKAGALKRWGTGIATAIKNNGTGINTDSTGNATATEKHSKELELEKRRKDLDLPKPETGGDAPGDKVKGDEGEKSKPPPRTAFDAAKQAAERAKEKARAA